MDPQRAPLTLFDDFGHLSLPAQPNHQVVHQPCKTHMNNNKIVVMSYKYFLYSVFPIIVAGQPIAAGQPIDAKL